MRKVQTFWKLCGGGEGGVTDANLQKHEIKLPARTILGRKAGNKEYIVIFL